MIYGIGTDLCHIARIAGVIQRHGNQFIRRILGENEYVQYEQYQSRNTTRSVRFLATRFAAKEALSKAIGLGCRTPMTWRAAQVMTLPSGQPYFTLADTLQTWITARQLTVHLSLTDEKEYALAFVIATVQLA